MNSFLVLYNEKQKNLFNDELLHQHIDYLRDLQQKGYLVLCGPFNDDNSAILIFRADSIVPVEEMVENDPYILGGYYKKFSIREFREANDENNWLL